MASHRAASMDTPKSCPFPLRGKPFNSKQPYNRVHRQGPKNPYDSTVALLARQVRGYLVGIIG